MCCIGYEMARYKGTLASHLYDAHTMYNQWATAPGLSLNYPRPKSITHICTFNDNGVYVALQLFLVILVSDQWHRVLMPDRTPDILPTRPTWTHVNSPLVNDPVRSWPRWSRSIVWSQQIWVLCRQYPGGPEKKIKIIMNIQYIYTVLKDYIVSCIISVVIIFTSIGNLLSRLKTRLAVCVGHILFIYLLSFI